MQLTWHFNVSTTRKDFEIFKISREMPIHEFLALTAEK